MKSGIKKIGTRIFMWFGLEPTVALKSHIGKMSRPHRVGGL
jgi:hypothetical protein